MTVDADQERTGRDPADCAYSEAMAAVTYSVRERRGNGYGPIIGHVAAADIPPDDGTLIDVNGRLMRILAVRAGDETIIVEPFADPG